MFCGWEFGFGVLDDKFEEMGVWLWEGIEKRICFSPVQLLAHRWSFGEFRNESFFCDSGFADPDTYL